MGRDLRMEVFASKDAIKPVSLHIYQLHSQKIDNSFSVIRGAVWKLRNDNHVGVFEDGNRIYSTDMLDESIPNADFTIEYEGIREIEVLENRKVYCELRGEQLSIGGYHLVVHVWIRNSKGEYLISQRSENRSTFPLMWECVSGSVVKGEDSLQGAVRETKEEVGIDLNTESGQREVLNV